jgi:hypothetical protein
MKNPRPLLRLVHLLAGGWIGTLIYSPWGSDTTFLAVTRFGLVPVVGLTGIALWQQAAFNRVIRRLELRRAGR